MKHFQCGNCGQIIEVPQGVPKPANCPRCGAPAMMIHRLTRVSLEEEEEEAEGLHGNARSNNLPFFYNLVTIA